MVWEVHVYFEVAVFFLFFFFWVVQLSQLLCYWTWPKFAIWKSDQISLLSLHIQPALLILAMFKPHLSPSQRCDYPLPHTPPPHLFIPWGHFYKPARCVDWQGSKQITNTCLLLVTTLHSSWVRRKFGDCPAVRGVHIFLRQGGNLSSGKGRRRVVLPLPHCIYNISSGLSCGSVGLQDNVVA